MNLILRRAYRKPYKIYNFIRFLVDDYLIVNMMILRKVTFKALDKIIGSIQTRLNDTI
jgi:hypothetical protein